MAGIGLTDAQASARLESEGGNELPSARPTTWTSALLAQLRDTMIVVLLVAAGLTGAMRDFPDMSVILAVIVINSLLGASQEVRSGHALAALADLTAPHATVLRQGVSCDVDAREVVRGDVLLLNAGAIVAADARVESAESLMVDEALLTGEAVPVAKTAGDAVRAGTVVTRGRGEATVTATGRGTAVGAIAQSLAATHATKTPLQRQLAVLGRRLAILVSIAAVAVGLLDILTGHSVETAAVVGISLAVAAIPESLPAVVSLSLALAARRLTRHGVLIRQLAAVEALGSVTVLAADKTGTLTTGRLELAQTWTPTGDAHERIELLTAAALCSDAAIESAPTGRRDDPIEIALVAGAQSAGVDVRAARLSNPRIAEEPFDAATSRMTTTHRSPDGSIRTICKGAPEVVFGDLANASAASEQANRLAAGGHRVLAVARRATGPWQPLGLLAFSDPPRADAPAVVAGFRRAGVRTIMITGDHAATATRVARDVGISPEDVFARVRPEGKTAVVATLQEAGEVVAMTGDGVNDAPALRMADIGVAMGKRGTEVAKQAAAIVLVNDDLAPMVNAIGEGRRAYDNVRRFLHYALSGGLAEIVIMLAGPAAGFPLPLGAGQILWVNLLTHGLPGVAIGSEPAEPDVLQRAPRRPESQLLDRHTLTVVAWLGSTIAAVSLLAGGYARHVDRPWQSTIFLTLTFAQLAVALALHGPWNRANRNPMLAASVVINVALAILAVWWHPLMTLLRTQPLRPGDLVPCIIAATVAGGLARAQVARHHRASPPPAAAS